MNPSLAALGRSEQGWTLSESGGHSLIPHLPHRFTVATFFPAQLLFCVSDVQRKLGVLGTLLVPLQTGNY